MPVKSVVVSKRTNTQNDENLVTEVQAMSAIRTLLKYLEPNTYNREGLTDTPRRVIKAWDEMTSGYWMDVKSVLSRTFPGVGYNEMIVCRGIEFHSTCEHHLLPFSGVAHVGYIPKSRVVGLSKLARLVDCFAKRLQIQEQLTVQILTALDQYLSPKGAAVVLIAKHHCMSCRGVEKQNSETVTCALNGAFKNHKVRDEFMAHSKIS